MIPVLRSSAKPQVGNLGLPRCPIRFRNHAQPAHHVVPARPEADVPVGAGLRAGSGQEVVSRMSGRFLGSPKPAISFSS